MVNQHPGHSWWCHIFPAPESGAKASVMVDFSLCWGCPSTQHLAASSGSLLCCKVLHWLNLSNFQTGSNPWLQAREEVMPAPALDDFSMSFQTFQPWEGQGQSWATPEGWNPQFRRPPWAPNTLQPGSHNITSLLAASSSRSHLNCQMNQHRNVSDCTEGFGWTWLVPGSSSPASRKQNVFCLLGRAVFSHLCFSTGYNPLHTPMQLLFFVQISRAIMRRMHGSHF